MTDHKAVERVTVKSEAEGRVEAVVATLNRVDKDGDVIESGAIGRQGVIVSPFAHSSFTASSLPAGKGTVREAGNEARADLEFFMDSRRGRDAFRTVRGLGPLASWSFGFDVRESADPSPQQRKQGATRVLKSLDVQEVSPVARGAGIDTRTLVAKADGGGGPTVDPSEFAAARETARKAAVRRDLARVKMPPGADTRKLGEFAMRVGFKLVGYPGMAWKRAAPSLEWFVPSRHPRTAGFMRPGEHSIHVARDLDGRELVRTVLHEARHIAQEAPKAAGAEGDADTFAERWAGAVKAAHRATGGDPHRIFVRPGRPPWYGEQIEQGDVVLSRRDSQAYQFNPSNTGNAWTGLYHD